MMFGIGSYIPCSGMLLVAGLEVPEGHHEMKYEDELFTLFSNHFLYSGVILRS